MKKVYLVLSFVLFSLCAMAQKAPHDEVSGFRGNNGMSYTFITTGTRANSIWGGANGIYTDDSKLGTAAVHAGLLKPGETGSVSVVIMEGMSSYRGNTRNGITSRDRRGHGGSFRFDLEQLSIAARKGNQIVPEAVVETVYEAPADLRAYRYNAGKVYSFRVTGSNSGDIWGGNNGIYTEESDLSTAAVHAGKLRAGEEGIIKIRMVKPQSIYPGALKNGIFSKDHGPWDSGFKFED